MDNELNPKEQYENFLKLFKESLTPDQAFLYSAMLSSQSEASKFHNELMRPIREAQEKARKEQEAAAKEAEIKAAAEKARKEAEEKKAAEMQAAVEEAKKANTTIKEVEVIKEVPTVPPVPASAPAPPVETAKLAVRTNKEPRQHYLLPLVTKALKARCHVWLVGPAGSGKTTLAADAATELKLPHAALSVCGQTTKTDLLGYVDAHGVYRATCFRQAYEHGGVFCLDEIDNGNANVLAVLNSALSSKITTFPDKTVERHKDFVVVACANTYGVGAVGGYVGRNAIDAATLDRFFFVEMPYDDGLEAYVAGAGSTNSPQWNEQGQNIPTEEEWLYLVRNTRDLVAELKIKAIVSPRATYMGLSLIKEGVPLPLLKKGLLYKSLSAENVAKLELA
jgi:cobaltochelatase CobS